MATHDEQLAVDQAARAAAALKNNDFLPFVLDKLKSDIVAQWRASADPELRERYWHMQRGIELIAGAIERECDNAIERGDRQRRRSGD